MPAQFMKQRDWVLVSLPVLCLLVASISAVWLGRLSSGCLSFLPGKTAPFTLNLTALDEKYKGAPPSLSYGESAGGANDPFGRIKKTAEKVVPPPVLKELSLSLVVVASAGRYCRINGKLFKEGAGGHGFVVRKIDEAGALIKTDAGEGLLRPGQKEDIILKPEGAAENSGET
ncbi:MAG: hypothetical protein M0022_08755 [Desulfobacteraceae bacterium]|nr:hypothetical protein [Desulfobacteraceae bacterium]